MNTTGTKLNSRKRAAKKRKRKTSKNEKIKKTAKKMPKSYKSNKKRDDLEVAIPEFGPITINKKEVIFYHIELKYRSKSWSVKKRFSDFILLNQYLLRVIDALPDLPPKSFFAIKKHEKLTVRKNKLEQYLKLLLERNEVYSFPYLMQFLEVN